MFIWLNWVLDMKIGYDAMVATFLHGRSSSIERWARTVRFNMPDPSINFNCWIRCNDRQHGIWENLSLCISTLSISVIRLLIWTRIGLSIWVQLRNLQNMNQLQILTTNSIGSYETFVYGFLRTRGDFANIMSINEWFSHMKIRGVLYKVYLIFGNRVGRCLN